MTKGPCKATPHRASSDCGSELVEMAIVLPIFILLIMGIMDFGFLFQRYELVVNAAREGARLASADASLSNPDVELRVQNYLSNAGLTGTASATAGNSTMTVSGVPIATKTVTVFYSSDFLFLPGSVNLRSVSIMRVEAGS
jgi:Flp pilus assembly protein TadG